MAMGCHPKSALDYTEWAEMGLRQALKHKKTVALGEIGLDYSRQSVLLSCVLNQYFYLPCVLNQYFYLSCVLNKYFYLSCVINKYFCLK